MLKSPSKPAIKPRHARLRKWPGADKVTRGIVGSLKKRLMKPHISVCIPVYQGASTLASTLRSVLASEDADFEVVVRDNGSTDGTGEVVAQFDDPRIRYVRSDETVPLPQNWQAAVEQARGELIKVVCADDLIHPSCLASQLALWRARRSVSSRAAATSSTATARS